MSQGLRNSSSSEEWQAVSFLCCAVITLPGQSCPGMQLPRHTAIPVTARCLLFPSTAALICMCQQIGTARQPRSEASVEGVCGGVGGYQGHGVEGRGGQGGCQFGLFLYYSMVAETEPCQQPRGRPHFCLRQLDVI